MHKDHNEDYDKAVQLIKKLKSSNELLSKAIGVQPYESLMKIKDEEQKKIKSIINELQILLSKMQSSYQNPDMVRKMSNLNKQYQIQTQKYSQLDKLIEKHTSNNNQQTTTTAGNNEYNYKQSYGKISKDSGQHETQLQCQVNYRQLNQKREAIKQIEERMIKIHSITDQTLNMTMTQGEHLDIIGDELFNTYSNTEISMKNVRQANKRQKSSKRKIIVFASLILLLIVMVIVGVAIL